MTLSTDDMYDLAKQAVGELAGATSAVDREDLVQEAVAWLLAHPHRVARQVDDNGDLFFQTVVYEIQKHVFGVRDADERQASPATGAWTAKRMRQVLPMVLDSVPEVGERPEVRSQTDPAHGMTWLATRMDVRDAMRAALSAWERRLLVDKYVLGKPWALMATQYESPAGTLSRQASEAIGVLCEHLNRTGGARPLGDGLGTRRVMSNATALAMTRYDERAE